MPSPMPIFFMRLANLAVEGSMCGSEEVSSAISSMLKNSAPRDVLGQVLGLGVALGGRQVHGAVEHDHVGRIEALGQPVRLDDPLRCIVRHGHASLYVSRSDSLSGSAANHSTMAGILRSKPPGMKTLSRPASSFVVLRKSCSDAARNENETAALSATHCSPTRISGLPAST